MAERDVIKLLESHGVKPTANRILIATALQDAGCPMSMTELETAIGTIDKSVISRTLALFRETHLVHVLPDSGESRYELCHSLSVTRDEDEHVHFYCVRCHRTICLEHIAVPEVFLPDGYRSDSVNYTVSGLCPDCRKLCN